jgi:ssDNA-binding Zn-finger/Zn-ribbon topoisomerase 1
MADTISVTCPECDKKLKFAAHLEGTKVRCKECDTVIRLPSASKGKPEKPKPAPAKGAPAKSAPAKSAPAKSAPAKAAPGKSAPPKAGAGKAPGKGKAEGEDDNQLYGVTEEYMGRRCPECAEALEDDDVICLWCGYNTTTRERARTRKVRDITGFDIFLHLLPGIACVLLVIALIGLDVWYCMSVDEKVFGDGAFFGFLGGQGMKIWISLIVAYMCWLAGGFAIRRLVFNYMPPEVEEKFGVGS